MKKIKIFSVILTAVMLSTALPLSGCSAEKRYSEVYTDLFDTVIEVICYAKSPQESENVCGTLYAILSEYHRESDIYSQYDGINNAAVLNKNAGKSAVKVSEELFDLLKFGKQAYADSLGTVNIMMGAVLRVWETYRSEGKTLPPDAELQSAAGHTSIDLLILDEANLTAYITDGGASVDLGAIAKGYAVQKAVEYLNENNIIGVLINAGGNVAAVGTKPDGGAWSVGIQDPRGQSGEYVKTVSIYDKCVVTSGDYQRYYTVDGKNYCHIIDPETLYPCEKYQSVSVICDDSAIADMLSTALFLLDEEQGYELAKKYFADVVWIDAEGEISGVKIIID